MLKTLHGDQESNLNSEVPFVARGKELNRSDDWEAAVQGRTGDYTGSTTSYNQRKPHFRKTPTILVIVRELALLILEPILSVYCMPALACKESIV